MATLKLCVLISGRGSNLQSLIDACRDKAFPAEISLTLSNVDGVQGLERAKRAGIPTTVLSHNDFKTRETFDSSLTETIERFDVDLICLAGFMRILSDGFVNHWFDRMINIHPSLLPDYKGLNVHERVIKAGEDFSGCTVHYVRPDMDTGPIIKQAKVALEIGDDASSLAVRVLEQEHIIYPEVVRLIAEDRIRIEKECVVIDGES